MRRNRSTIGVLTPTLAIAAVACSAARVRAARESPFSLRLGAANDIQLRLRHGFEQEKVAVPLRRARGEQS